jgi:hypothetical protein
MDDFFDLGGTSLEATRLAEAIERELGAPVTVGWILDNPSPHWMAENLRSRG